MKVFLKIKEAANKQPSRFGVSIAAGVIGGLSGLGAAFTPMKGLSVIPHIAISLSLGAFISIFMFLIVAMLVWSNTMGLDRWVDQQHR